MWQLDNNCSVGEPTCKMDLHSIFYFQSILNFLLSLEMAIFTVLLTLKTRLGVFRVTGLKSLGRVGMKVFFFKKIRLKSMILCIL